MFHSPQGAGITRIFPLDVPTPSPLELPSLPFPAQTSTPTNDSSQLPALPPPTAIGEELADVDEMDRAVTNTSALPTSSSNERGSSSLLSSVPPSEQGTVTDRSKERLDLHPSSPFSSNHAAGSSHVLGPHRLSPTGHRASPPGHRASPPGHRMSPLGHSVLQQSPLASDSEEEEEEEEEGDQQVPGSGGEGSPLTVRRHLSRVGSVFVSEWGVEHTLKLKEEEGEIEEEEESVSATIGRDGQEEEIVMPSNALPADSHQESPVITATAGEAVSLHPPHQGDSGGGNWWSQALAETQHIDDFDSLIDNIDSTSAGAVLHSSTARHQSGSTSNLVAHGPTSSTSSSSSSSFVRDVEKDGHQVHTGGRQNQSPTPQTGTCHERRPSPSSSPAEGTDYILQAGKLISQGLQSEQSSDYQEALDLFKAGVDVLLNGVQSKLHCFNLL